MYLLTNASSKRHGSRFPPPPPPPPNLKSCMTPWIRLVNRPGIDHTRTISGMPGSRKPWKLFGCGTVVTTVFIQNTCAVMTQEHDFLTRWPPVALPVVAGPVTAASDATSIPIALHWCTETDTLPMTMGSAELDTAIAELLLSREFSLTSSYVICI